jgi:hypothetical protein
VLISELERTTELRGPGPQTEAAPVDQPGTDWERELERVRIELDTEHQRFAAELLRHEGAVFKLLSRKARATEGLSKTKGDGT